MTLISLTSSPVSFTGTGTAASSWEPNRPTGITWVPLWDTPTSDYGFDFSPYPAVSDSGSGFDGSSHWAVNGNGGSGMSRVSDAGQLHSPTNALDILYPGSGAGGGGNGSLGVDLGGLGTVKRLYVCTDVWHASDAELNSISNKFMVVFCNAGAGGNYNFEYRFNSGYFCLLDGPGSGQINGPAFGADGTALNTWVKMEICLDAIAGTAKWWVNGALQWTYSHAIFTPWDSFLLSSTWGGGGTHTHAWHRRHGHLTIRYTL
jgi:hypothetical protein